MRTLRVLPALLFATASLLAVKVADMAVRHDVFAPAVTPAAAQEDEGAGAEAEENPDIVPAIEEGRPVELGGPDDLPQSERAILESLAERRQVLEERAREMNVREDLLKAAEERIESRIEELRALEAAIGGAAAEEEARRAAQNAALVTMYETMRPKDAARIFNGLELDILIQVVEAMAPRKMADVLAAMDARAAQRVTTEIALRSTGETHQPTPPTEPGLDDLPKIEGRPSAEAQ